MHDSRRTRLILGVLLVAALALITVDSRDVAGGPISGLRGIGGTIFGSAESLVGSVARPFINFEGGSYVFSWIGGAAKTFLPTLPGYGPGGPPGPTTSLVRTSGINNKGQIVGSALINVCVQDAAFVIQKDQMTELPHLATRPNTGSFPPAMCGSSEANAINESGLIVGSSFDGNASRAVMWDKGVIKALAQ